MTMDTGPTRTLNDGDPQWKAISFEILANEQMQAAIAVGTRQPVVRVMECGVGLSVSG
jgi:hypothetical protein